MLLYTFTSTKKLFTDTDIGVRGLLKVTPHFRHSIATRSQQTTENTSVLFRYTVWATFSQRWGVFSAITMILKD